MPTSLTLAAKTVGTLDELRPHAGLFPHVGLYPNGSGLTAKTAGVLTLTPRS